MIPRDAATTGPRHGLLGLLAGPVGDGRALGAALAALQPTAIGPLLERLEWHRVDGLAHRALRAFPGDATHPWLRAALKRRHQRRAAATLAQGLALAEILEEFQRHGVPVVVLRGVRHAEWVYRDPGARPFEDHDLLVGPADEASARAVLRRLGFEAAASLLFRRGGVLVDLHTDPLGARRRPARRALFPLPVLSLFRRAAAGRVAGAPALLLEPEDEILLLAAHLVKHSFDRLIRIADLAHAVAVHGPAIRWGTLRERADAARLGRVLARAFEAAELLGVEVPEPFRGLPRGRIETALMTRVLALRPLPWSGEVIMALAAGGPAPAMRFLMDALLPAGEIPANAPARVAALPRRTTGVATGAVRWMAERRAR